MSQPTLSVGIPQDDAGFGAAFWDTCDPPPPPQSPRWSRGFCGVQGHPRTRLPGDEGGGGTWEGDERKKTKEQTRQRV